MYYLQCVYLATTTTYLCVEYCACSAGLDPAVGELCNDRSEESVQCAWSTISCNGLKSGFLRMCICAPLYIEDHHSVCEMYGPTCMYMNKTMLLTCMCIFICKQVHYFELLITYARIKLWASIHISFHGHHIVIASISTLAHPLTVIGVQVCTYVLFWLQLVPCSGLHRMHNTECEGPCNWSWV